MIIWKLYLKNNYYAITALAEYQKRYLIIIYAQACYILLTFVLRLSCSNPRKTKSVFNSKDCSSGKNCYARKREELLCKKNSVSHLMFQKCIVQLQLLYLNIKHFIVLQHSYWLDTNKPLIHDSFKDSFMICFQCYHAKYNLEILMLPHYNFTLQKGQTGPNCKMQGIY